MPIQTEWPLSLTTPLGADTLLPEGYTASEGISQLYQLRIGTISEGRKGVDFDQLLGQGVTLKMKAAAGTRHWNGIVNRIIQGDRTTEHTAITLEVVPKLWLLTRVSRSRIFQSKTVPDILKDVLKSLDVTYQIQGTFEPRNYCVQYRETDFNFISRLMEEEGIFYFFEHTDGKHQMIVGNAPTAHSVLPLSTKLVYDESHGGAPRENRIHTWQKTQEIRSGKTTLWDHCFQLPNKNLAASKTAQETANVGDKSMKLKLPVSADLEQYDYPGGYAQRFDGDVNGIFTDNGRTVQIRMQAETAQGLIFLAESDCREVVSGHKFSLDGHFSDSGQGKLTSYVVVRAEHSASHSTGATRGGDAFRYSNRFTCMPEDIPYRPPRQTPTPTVRGAQTATVVGPAGEEIFTDKYGRVKVQFPWDREGKNDANSSCWLRVASPWAGKQWGMIHIPRVGDEVLVDFLEGDPDRPIIVGSVYNADHMPPYALPANKTQCGIKSRSSKQGGAENFNEIRFEDKAGKEQIFIHAEKDMLTEVENDETRTVGHDRTTTIKNHETKTVQEGNETIEITRGNQSTTLGQGNQSTTIKMGNQSIAIKMGNQATKLDLGKAETEAMQSIELKVGQSSIKLDQTGVTIKGMNISIQGTIQVQVKGLMTQVNGDATLIAKGGIVMIN